MSNNRYYDSREGTFSFMELLFVNIGVLFCSALHIWFFILEIFLWEKPKIRKIFHTSAEFAHKSVKLAANQGLYNGFLAAGLIWSVTTPDPTEAIRLKIFFLSCVTLAGIFGGLSVNKKILFVQALPAIITLCLLVASL